MVEKRKREGVRGGQVSPPMRADDKKGHYVFALRENLTPRYKILSKLGEGAFGKVVECLDRETREHVAVKILRNLPESGDAATREIRTLEYIVQDELGKSHFVLIKDSFCYRNHWCIVFEKLGPSLSDYLKRNRCTPFPMDLVHIFARQLLASVAYLHDLRRIHTDLKPHNILLENLPGTMVTPLGQIQFRSLPMSSTIKLIDFGLTVNGFKDHNHMIQTRPYRAPEVILGIEWCYPCDLWSVGCILWELLSGKTLFNTHDDLEHLVMMERVLGPLPKQMVQRAADKKFFKRGSQLKWPAGAASKERRKVVSNLQPLKNMVVRGTPLADLLHGLLRFDPSERLTARQALHSPLLYIIP